MPSPFKLTASVMDVFEGDSENAANVPDNSGALNAIAPVRNVGGDANGVVAVYIPNPPPVSPAYVWWIPTVITTPNSPMVITLKWDASVASAGFIQGVQNATRFLARRSILQPWTSSPSLPRRKISST